jgi:hypothetical protein
VNSDSESDDSVQTGVNELDDAVATVRSKRDELNNRSFCMQQMTTFECCKQGCCRNISFPLTTAFEMRRKFWLASSNNARNTLLVSWLPASMHRKHDLKIGDHSICVAGFCNMLGISRNRFYARFSPPSPTSNIRVKDESTVMRYGPEPLYFLIPL